MRGPIESQIIRFVVARRPNEGRRLARDLRASLSLEDLRAVYDSAAAHGRAAANAARQSIKVQK